MKQKLVFFFMFLFSVLLIAANPQAQRYADYKIKAFILKTLANDIDWPSESGINDKSKPFVIGVLGADPFDSYLEELYADKKIKGKNVQIIYFSDFRKITLCHMVFITDSFGKFLSEICSFSRNKPVLTIGDSEGFAEKGVHINFCISQKPVTSVCLEINEKAIVESKLKVAETLLLKARNINPLRTK